jgi:hypothetical protein
VIKLSQVRKVKQRGKHGLVAASVHFNQNLNVLIQFLALTAGDFIAVKAGSNPFESVVSPRRCGGICEARD